MDDAFHASERTWISKTSFIGEEEVEFLRHWGKSLTKEAIDKALNEWPGSGSGHSQSGDNDSIDDPPTTGTESSPNFEESGGMDVDGENMDHSYCNKEARPARTGTRTETEANAEEERRNVLKEIEAMGDEMFGVKPKKKKQGVATTTNDNEPTNSKGVATTTNDNEPTNSKGVATDPSEIPVTSDSEDEELYLSMLAGGCDEDDESEYTETSPESDDSESDSDSSEFKEAFYSYRYGKGATPLAIEDTKKNESVDALMLEPESAGTATDSIEPTTTATSASGASTSEIELVEHNPGAVQVGQVQDQPNASSSALSLPGCSTSGPSVGQNEGGKPVNPQEEKKKSNLLDKYKFFDNYHLNYINQKKVALKRDPEFLVRQKKMQWLLGMNDKQYQALVKFSTLGYEETRRIPIVDNPITIGGSMPLLAPPIPHYALKTNSSLAIYANFSNQPGAFQWKCKSVNQQITDDIESTMQKRKRDEMARILPTCNQDQIVDKSKDVIMTVVFYHPSKRRDKEPARPVDPDPALTVNILGSQTLKDLRNCFYCKNDLVCPEIQGNDLPPSQMGPEALLNIRESNLDKPCAIFVGNTIYRNSASRQNSSTDYGKLLLTWAARKRTKIVGPFEMGEMENTRMIDLVFKHGFPYLFIHQGNCEHLIVFEHVRLLNAEDPLLRSSFPEIKKPNFKTIYCAVDNKRIARFAVRKMDLFPHDPMIVCSDCLERYCYHRGKKVCDFQVYAFYQLSRLF